MRVPWMALRVVSAIRAAAATPKAVLLVSVTGAALVSMIRVECLRVECLEMLLPNSAAIPNSAATATA